MDSLIFIPGNVPSSKNSKVKTAKGIFHSKTVMKYIRSLGIQDFSVTRKTYKGYVDPLRPNMFLGAFNDANWVKPEGQVLIALHFVRDSKRMFDFHNVSQIVFDLMVAHDLIEDDSMDWMIPFPLKANGLYYSVDKKNPGVYLKIITEKTD